MAASIRRRRGSETLNPTALVNEVWLKLSNYSGAAPVSQLHFKRIAARAMRQVLTDHARRRMTAKHGGGNDTVFIPIDSSTEPAVLVSEELVSLNDALDRLAQMNPRQAAMVESRFFGGLEIPEIAELLGVSEATILRDWRAAKAWLAKEFRRV